MRVVIAVIILIILALFLISSFGNKSNESSSTIQTSQQKLNDDVSSDKPEEADNKIEGHDGTNLNLEKIDITRMAPPDRRRTVDGLTGKSIDGKENTDSDTEHTDLKGKKLFE